MRVASVFCEAGHTGDGKYTGNELKSGEKVMGRRRLKHPNRLSGNRAKAHDCGIRQLGVKWLIPPVHQLV